MNSTTVAVDLAKNVFEIAIAGVDWRITERHRLNRTKSLGSLCNARLARSSWRPVAAPTTGGGASPLWAMRSDCYRRTT
jgi:hypothetical protein